MFKLNSESSSVLGIHRGTLKRAWQEGQGAAEGFKHDTNITILITMINLIAGVAVLEVIEVQWNGIKDQSEVASFKYIANIAIIIISKHERLQDKTNITITSTFKWIRRVQIDIRHGRNRKALAG